MSYFKKTFANLSWMGVLRGSSRVVTIIRLAILGRLLAPADFGLFGIATLILAFLEIITETGINVFFIQNEGDLPSYVDTAWVVSILRGSLMAVAMVVTAPLIAGFFHNPAATSLVMFAALVPLIRGFINPSEISFQKNLEFNKEFIFRFSIFFVDSATAVVFSLITRSAVGLIWGLVAGASLEVILSQCFIKPRPHIRLHWPKFKHVIQRGKWVTISGLLLYSFTNGDNIAVGRMLGSAPLGLYDMAFGISMIPLSEVGDTFGQVLFPTLTHIREDKARLRKAYLKVVLSLFALTAPIGLILFVFTQPIVALVLGSKWLSIIPVLKLLSIFGVIRAVTGSSSALFYALKRQEYVTYVTIFNVLGLLIPIVPLVNKYGFYGAGISAGIGTLAALPLICYYLWRELA